MGTLEETPGPRFKGQVAWLRVSSESFSQKIASQAERQEELELAERPGGLAPSFAGVPPPSLPRALKSAQGGGRDAPLGSQCFPPLVFFLSFINLVATDAA